MRPQCWVDLATILRRFGRIANRSLANLKGRCLPSYGCLVGISVITYAVCPLEMCPNRIGRRRVRQTVITHENAPVTLARTVLWSGGLITKRKGPSMRYFQSQSIRPAGAVVDMNHSAVYGGVDTERTRVEKAVAKWCGSPFLSAFRPPLSQRASSDVGTQTVMVRGIFPCNCPDGLRKRSGSSYL